MHNGDGKALPSCLYPIKYLNVSLPYDYLFNDAILLISTSKIYGFLFHFYTMKRKKSQNFLF